MEDDLSRYVDEMVSLINYRKFLDIYLEAYRLSRKLITYLVNDSTHTSLK
jgi:hypothetical protein